MSDASYTFPGYLIDIIDKDWVTDIIEFENIDIKTEYLPNTPDSDITKRNTNSQNKKVETPWQKLISRSEKVVCYPSSLINIRYLISDEMAFVASQVRKLVGTQHPLLKTAKTLIGDKHGVSQLRGLLVLLVSKSFNNQYSSINANQRSLAEIVETAHAALRIHRDLVNIENNSKAKISDWSCDMQFGNKMATLCGDYLLASVSKALADFQNTNIVDLISNGIGDSIESIFFKVNDINDDQYRKYIYLSSGSLFSKCCKAAVSLRTNDIEDQIVGDEKIAENWAIHWCEFYNICENIYTITQKISPEKVESKIFQYNNQLCITNNLSENLQMLREQLYNTRMLIRNVHKQFPDNNKQSKNILAEMVELLYQDAVINVNLCKMF